MSEKGTRPRVDRVELQGGIVHLPAEFREVARKANQAGLEGWQFVDADYGMDTRVMDDPEAPWVSRVEITYEAAKEPERLRKALEAIEALPRARPGLWGGQAADIMRDIAMTALLPTPDSAEGDGLAGVDPNRRTETREEDETS